MHRLKIALVGLFLMAPWLLAALGPPMPVGAQGWCPGLNRPLTPYAAEALATSTSAQAFTVATYTAGGAAPAMAVADVQTSAVMYRTDGSAPTGRTGHVAHVGARLVICGQDVGKFQVILQETTTTAGTLFGTFYK